jgi:hypothetical protein
VEVEKICAPDSSGARPALRELLDKLATILPELSDSICGAYLEHVIVSR